MDRLLEPPRVEGYCPGKHCARACGAFGGEPCRCKPCRPSCPCQQLFRRVRARGLRRDVPSDLPVSSALRQQSLFAIPSATTRSQS